MLGKTEIHGFPFKGKYLTVEMLKQEGLEPRRQVKIGDSVIWFSSVAYELGDRKAAVAYVEKGDKIVARTYYLSNSQGVWRYLPEYHLDKHGRVDHYGKGYDEASIILPVPMQLILAELTKSGAVFAKPKNPELVFVGTARLLDPKNTYYLTTESTPKELEGNLFGSKGTKIAPEQIKLKNPAQNPDFDNLVANWQQESGLYGRINFDVYPSKDGQMQFIFCRDSKGRAWIGGIEDISSPMQPTGLRKSWLNGYDLFTPAYEYKIGDVDQTGGYGNDNMRNGQYVDMYTNYLSKIPLIKEYLSQKAKF